MACQSSAASARPNAPAPVRVPPAATGAPRSEQAGLARWNDSTRSVPTSSWQRQVDVNPCMFQTATVQNGPTRARGRYGVFQSATPRANPLPRNDLRHSLCSGRKRPVQPLTPPARTTGHVPGPPILQPVAAQRVTPFAEPLAAAPDRPSCAILARHPSRSILKRSAPTCCAPTPYPIRPSRRADCENGRFSTRCGTTTYDPTVQNAPSCHADRTIPRSRLVAAQRLTGWHAPCSTVRLPGTLDRPDASRGQRARLSNAPVRYHWRHGTSGDAPAQSRPATAERK